MCVVTVVVFVASGASAGEVVFDTEPVRHWPVSTAFVDGSISVDGSVDGTTVVTATEEADDETACRIVVADNAGVTTYRYRHEFRSTQCIDAVADPEGGFFVRGEREVVDEEEAVGFTSRIAVDGEVVWAVDDEQLLEQEPFPEGPGQFRGDYVEPAQGLTYDVEEKRLMGLTTGQRVRMGDEQSVVQAHIIDAATGELEVAGLEMDANEALVDVEARDGAFLLTTFGELTGPRFYSYRADRTVDEVEPEGEDWASRRVVAPVVHRRGLGSFVMWIDEDPTELMVGLVRVEGLDSTRWSEEYELTGIVDGRQEFLGQPVGMWVGEEYAAVLHDRGEGQQFLRMIDTDDGTARGSIRWTDVPSQQDPIGMATSVDGELRLVAVDRDTAEVWEYRLAPVAGGGAIGDDEETGDRACGQAPGSPSLVVAVVGLLWLIRRQRLAQTGLGIAARLDET